MDTPEHRGPDGTVFGLGNRVKVVDQDICGEILRWDGSKAVVLDDDCDEWMEGDDDGTLVYPLRDLILLGSHYQHTQNPPRPAHGGPGRSRLGRIFPL